MSEKTKLVITTAYRLSRQGKKFDGDVKRGIMFSEDKLVERVYAEEMNEFWEQRGKKYVIDEEASIEAQEIREEKAIKRIERDEARETAGKAVAAMALGINAKAKEDEPEGSMAHSVKELKEMSELREMDDVELDEFFKTETRATGKALLGELIVANNDN